ncbi:C-X-C motif chemokine 16 isoform X1 [Mirounga leonina]|uniref:C-X-C motif chemokine 16 isoform X1 n=1 Tax=Mirounga leonina TaxID=9715 RepID=UPI00156C451C|nr:C-X-C motif chemokine 16 isoform X1 [Mirounga leonina]
MALDAAPRPRLAPGMRRPWRARLLALLFVLAQLPPPGSSGAALAPGSPSPRRDGGAEGRGVALSDGNEGSAIGSCYCHKAIPSGRPPMAEFMAHLRKHLRAYDRCNSYVRFQLQARSVCGGSKDSWVQQLMSCFDRKECGYANSGSAAPQEHLPPPSTQVPEPTQRAPSDTGSPAQTYPPPASQSTVQPTLPAGARSLDKNLTRANEIATSTEGRSLAAGPEAGERHKQLEEKVGPSAGTSAMVPVLSLLAIIFILTIVLLYVLCKRMAHSLPQSPDLQLPYIPVASDSKA